MPIVFPPIEQATQEGLIAIGGHLDVETLTTAYTQGIFPWPFADIEPLTWFAPDPRGILDFSSFKIPRSMKRFLNQTNMQVRFNQDFEEVIHQCAMVKRKHESETWITKDVLKGYIELFHHELAYNVAVYKEEKLVGGLYGVCFGEIISGESMFHLEDNASKFALISLIERLKKNGIRWIDTQMVTPTVEIFGGKYITRTVFMQKLGQLNKKRTRQDLFNE